MSSELHHKDSNGLSVLSACPDDELHETGLRGLSYSLECEGWKVHFIGANAPVETLASFIGAARPDLVCLSVTMGRHRGQLLNGLRNLASLVHSYHGRIIIGGSYTTKLEQHDVTCDYIARSIQDAIAYSRDAFHLKPGAKRNAEPKNKLHRKSEPQNKQP